MREISKKKKKTLETKLHFHSHAFEKKILNLKRKICKFVVKSKKKKKN